MYIYYHFTIQLGTFMIYFSLFHIEIEVTVAGLLAGRGQRYIDPSKIIEGLAPRPPFPMPMLFSHFLSS